MHYTSINYKVDELQAFRQVSDEAGDKLIKDLYEDLSPKEIGKLFQRFINELDEVDYQQMPDSLRHYFEDHQHLPDWTDWDKVSVAEDLFLKIGPEYALSLLARGLAVGYVAANTVKVLTSTGYLSSDVKYGTAKRIMETTQFVFDVMSRNAMKPNGRGIKSVLKVRFIHSMVRHHLTKHGWNAAQFGVPVNQEDMSGTILSFSVAAILGLEKLNVQLSAEEKDSIVHLWSLIGHVIGLVPELNPHRYEDARDLYLTILEHQAAVSEDGKILVKALGNFIKNAVDLNILPGFQDQLMRLLIDDDRYCDMLDISQPKNPLERISFDGAVAYLRILNRFRENFWVDQAAKPLNRFLGTKALAYFDSEFDMKLYLPPDIREAWGILEPNDLRLLRGYPMIRSIVAQGRAVLSLG